jgi:hypothetical protein
MPIDSLADATVEAKESAAAAPPAAAAADHAAAGGSCGGGQLIKAGGGVEDPCVQTPEEVRAGGVKPLCSTNQPTNHQPTNQLG